MAYNKSKDVTAGYISPLHQELLQQLIFFHQRTKRGEIEWLIAQTFINEWGYERYRVFKDDYEADRLAALQGPREEMDEPTM